MMPGSLATFSFYLMFCFLQPTLRCLASVEKSSVSPGLQEVTLNFSFCQMFLFFSRHWKPCPVPVSTATWIWRTGKAHRAPGQLLPGGDPQDGRLPVRSGHQARQVSPPGQQVSGEIEAQQFFKIKPRFLSFCLQAGHFLKQKPRFLSF